MLALKAILVALFKGLVGALTKFGTGMVSKVALFLNAKRGFVQLLKIGAVASLFTTFLMMMTAILASLVLVVDDFSTQFFSTSQIWTFLHYNINYFFPLDTLLACLIVLIAFNYTGFGWHVLRWSQKFVWSIISKFFN